MLHALLLIPVMVAGQGRTERAGNIDYTKAYPGLGSCDVLEGTKPWHSRLIVSADAPLFIRPGVLPTPLVLLEPGRVVNTMGAEGEFFLVEVQLPYGTTSRAFIHCAQAYPSPSSIGPDPRQRQVAAASAAPLQVPPVPDGHPEATPQPQAQNPGTRRLTGPLETVHGYVEWQRPGYLVTDGQRIAWSRRSRFRIGARDVDPRSIPLGYEITATGIRDMDGALVVVDADAKPNGESRLESQAAQMSARVEAQWLASGQMTEMGRDRKLHAVGRIVSDGPDVDRVNRVVAKILPSYIPRTSVRVRVVDAEIWNAAAMPNGSVWVFRGLLEDVTDDELAAVLGHELAHFTHEHSRRQAATSAWANLANGVLQAGVRSIERPGLAAGLDMARWLGINAWVNGYSRDLEDQADRVGLRYAHEGGFNASAGPVMWHRKLQASGQQDRIGNWFFGDHSRATDRIANLEREIRLNYAAQ